MYDLIHIEFTDEHHEKIGFIRRSLIDMIEDAKRLAEHTDEMMSGAENTIESAQEIVALIV